MLRSGIGKAIAGAAVVAYVARVLWVNVTAETIPREIYAAQQTVPLGGAFFQSRDAEDTTDYCVEVVDAKRMTRNEYLSEEEQAEKVADDAQKSVVCLEVRITNSGNAPGSFNLLFAMLTAKNGSDYFIADTELWSQKNPKVSQGLYIVSVRPYTSYVAKIPFARNEGADTRYVEQVSPGTYEWAVADYPSKKAIEIELD